MKGIDSDEQLSVPVGDVERITWRMGLSLEIEIRLGGRRRCFATGGDWNERSLAEYFPGIPLEAQKNAWWENVRDCRTGSAVGLVGFGKSASPRCIPAVDECERITGGLGIERTILSMDREALNEYGLAR